ncbi:cationic peroxidase 1-like [Vigna umbellata]|uniref:cationic peroxidase 1-like n=1 Tax=Vigna umbellata TaxID=87088 RepID=UPI001F5F26B8|nr:cationic peroxidase 1-like [Vigna umbellata]XP_047165226.1 cationic peroxidase 1-like [Vigna umbellata]
MAAISQQRVKICLVLLCLVSASAYSTSSSTTTSVTLSNSLLNPLFYAIKCPQALDTIKNIVINALANDPRMGASLLRLHFHDCFVQGCDASVLLADTATFRGEQSALPNVNSLRGFEVVEKIKYALEHECPGVVSCADILAVAARDSVVALGGPGWPVGLGRRDSTTASFSGANTDLPSPFLNLDGLIAAFQKKLFTAKEMVALSGAHTIGSARCLLFRSRIYNESDIDPTYAIQMRANCPKVGGDSNLSPIDITTKHSFDNAYYTNLINKRGLFHSDQQLFSGGSTATQVKSYSTFPLLFKFDFANAMLKMSNLSPLTGTQGQIRKVCSRVN